MTLPLQHRPSRALVALLALGVVLGLAAPAPAQRPLPRLASHRLFQRWYEANRSRPEARLALKLARQLTWGQVALIDKAGGVQMWQGKQGCEHDCKGCWVNGGMRKIQTMSWGDFKHSVNALLALETALNEAMALAPGARAQQKRFRLVQRSPEQSSDCHANLIPFFDSEPMSHHIKTQRGGVRSIADMARHLHDKTGSFVQIVSSGWNPKDPTAQGAAEKIVKESRKARSPVAHLTIQVKPMSHRFVREAQGYLMGVLAKDPRFSGSGEHAADFKAFGLNFERYRDGAGALAAYESVLNANLAGLIKASPYLRARIDNIRTLYPLLPKTEAEMHSSRATLNFALATEAELSRAPMSWRPLVKESFVRSLANHIIDTEFDGLRGVLVGWTFPGNTANRQPLYKTEKLGKPMVQFNGTIAWTGADAGMLGNTMPDEAAHKSAHVRDLANRPVLARNPRRRPYWKVAADRLDGARSNTTLSAYEVRSIEAVVRRLLRQRGLSAQGLKVRNRAEPHLERGLASPGDPPHPRVRVRTAEQMYWFDLGDGTLTSG